MDFDNGYRKKVIMDYEVDDSFLENLDEDVLGLGNTPINRWSVINRPPITEKQATIEFENGVYSVSLYIYVELLTKGLEENAVLRGQIDSLLDRCLSLEKMCECLSTLLRNVDRLRPDNLYKRGVLLMGVAQCVNNIVSREFNPKALGQFSVYIKLLKLIMKYFKLSVQVLKSCNLQIEFDAINNLNYNLAVIETNYGIILTSPDLVAMPDCKRYLEAGQKALRAGLARLNILLDKDPTKRYLMFMSRVLDLLGDKSQAKTALNAAVNLNTQKNDLSTISYTAVSERNRKYKHLIDIYRGCES